MSQVADPVYKVYDPEMKAEIFRTINAIRAETVPIEGHDDPGAIADCWNTVIEKLSLIVRQLTDLEQKHYETIISFAPFLTIDILKQIPEGEIFRVVTTRIQNVYEPMKAELTFICKKGHGHDDWAIYCHRSDRTIQFIKEQGDKVTVKENIQSICPCTDEVLDHYQF